MNSKEKNTYWQDSAQAKKVPSTHLRARVCEDSNGTTFPCASTQPGNPPDQHKTGPGPQLTPIQRTKRNKRNYTTVKWSTEEKKIILFCFTYSRFEKWGRRKREIFEELKKTNLPPEKLNTTNPNKLQSIVSQIHVYVKKEEIDNIKNEALKRAESDFELVEESKNLEYGKSHWNREEKWVLLWATEYAREKYTNRTEQSKEWQRIFHHHCPNKKGIPRYKLTNQKNNTIVLKIFNEEEINDMKTKVKLMIGKGKCPIKEPITSPNPNTSISKSKSVESTLQDQLRSPSNETNIETLIYTDPQLVRTRPAPPEPPDSPSSSSSSNPEEHSSPERA